MKDESFLFTCREAAKSCSDVLIAKMLRDAADALAAALALLTVRATPNNMRDVVALWTKAHVILQKAKTPPNPGPTHSGFGELERMAA